MKIYPLRIWKETLTSKVGPFAPSKLRLPEDFPNIFLLSGTY